MKIGCGDVYAIKCAAKLTGQRFQRSPQFTDQTVKVLYGTAGAGKLLGEFFQVGQAIINRLTISLVEDITDTGGNFNQIGQDFGRICEHRLHQ